MTVGDDEPATMWRPNFARRTRSYLQAAPSQVTSRAAASIYKCNAVKRAVLSDREMRALVLLYFIVCSHGINSFDPQLCAAREHSDDVA